MPARTFDVIVVGTGAGGGTAMKLLCEAGLSVCAINSGPRLEPSKHYRMHRQVYDLKYRGFGNPMRLEGKAHQEPYSVEESEYSEGKDLFEHDVAYSNGPGTDWYWKRCKATGGKANFWGRSSARYGDIDFKAADLDGFGENWLVDYAEISPWFSKAERYMGVASTVQNRPSNPDGEYLPPIPWRCIDYIIQKGAEKIGLPYLPDRCAQLTVAQRASGLPLLRELQPGLRRRSVFLSDLVHDSRRRSYEEPDAPNQRSRAKGARRRRWHGQGRRVRRSSHQAGSGSLLEGGCACGVLRGDGAHYAEFEVASLAHRYREFQWTARPQSVRSLVRQSWLRLLTAALGPACYSGQHCRFDGCLDAALAELEESTRRKIRPRLLGVHRWRLWGVPRPLQPNRGLWRRVQAQHQALLSDSDRRAHSSAFSAQPHKLRRH